MQVGKYELIHKLATGGMAEVFLAKAAGPMGFEKTLVLKRILPHLAEETSFVEMFLSEARLAAQLNHPNVVQIFDFGEAGGAWFLAMEYIDGPNLRVLIKRAASLGLSLPPALCARIIASACEGLAFAHDFCDPATGQPLGLVHRDISPDNILLSRQGAVKVVDFGIAKAAGQSHRTQTGIVKGKLAYMPPEQLRNTPLDRRVDVYALGVVFYELLTGRKPFDANTDASIVQSILFEPLIPAMERRPDLPQAVQQLLDRALAKDREQRYPDCRAFQIALERFILSTGEPIGAWQLAQLVMQVTAGTDTPAPTPQPGSPPRSAPKVAAIPVQPPPPPVEKTSELVPPITAPLHITRTVELRAAPPPEAPPTPGAALVPAMDKAVPGAEKPPESARQRRRRIPVAVGTGLLLMGGGYMLCRPASEPMPEPPAPLVAAAPTPELEKPAEAPALKAGETALPTPSPVPPEPQQPPLPSPRSSPPRNSSPSPLAAPLPPTQLSAQPSPRKTVVAKGSIEFQIRPFAKVYVNGRYIGESPLPAYEVPPGQYTVTAINEELNKAKTQLIDVKANETSTFKANLLKEPSTAGALP